MATTDTSEMADKQSDRIEHDHALERALITFIKDHTEFYKQFKDNADFGRFISNLCFMNTYHPPDQSGGL